MWEEESRALRRGGTGESRLGTGNLGQASLLTKAFHLPLRFPLRQFAPSSGILLSTYLIRKLFFSSSLSLPMRTHKGKVSPSHAHTHTPEWLKTSPRFEREICPFYPRQTGFLWLLTHSKQVITAGKQRRHRSQRAAEAHSTFAIKPTDFLARDSTGQR